MEVRFTDQGARYNAAEIGPQVTAPTVYRVTSGKEGGCTAFNLQDIGFTLYEIGTPIPWDAYPLVERGLVGDSDYGTFWHHDGSGQPILPESPNWNTDIFHRTADESTCRTFFDVAGEYKCAQLDSFRDAEVPEIWLYSDDTCRSPLVEVDISLPAPEFVAVTGNRPTCSAEWEPAPLLAYYEAGEEFTGTVWYVYENTCSLRGENKFGRTYHITPANTEFPTVEFDLEP